MQTCSHKISKNKNIIHILSQSHWPCQSARSFLSDLSWASLYILYYIIHVSGYQQNKNIYTQLESETDV